MNEITTLEELIRMIVIREHTNYENVRQRCQYCMQEIASVTALETKLKIMKYWLDLEDAYYLVFLEPS